MLRVLGAILTCAVMLVSVNAPAWANDEDDCKNYAYKAGSYRDFAIAACSRLIAKNRGNASNYLQRALLYEIGGDLDHTIDDLKEAVRLGGDQSTSIYQMALCNAYRKRGDVILGIEVCSQLIGRKNLDISSSQLSDAYRARAEFYLKKGDRDSAAADLGKAFKLAPTWSRDEVRAQLVSIVGEEKFLAVIGAPTTTVPVNKFSDAPKLPATEAKTSPIVPGNEAKVVSGGELGGRPSSIVASSNKSSPVPTQVTPGRRVALILGNSSYKFMPSLINPKNDAFDIASTLRNLGFETVTATDLNKADVDGALSRFSRLVPGSDIAMIYYSGHGMQFEGKNYLLPVDARLETSADVNRFQLMPVDDLVDVLSAAAGLQLIVLDACRNNVVERDFKNKIASAPGGNRDATSTRGFARIEARSGLLITYSTAPNQVAADGMGRNSPFTEAFLKEVVTPDLEIRQMLYRVQSNVYNATGKRQIPEISSLYIGPDIRLATSSVKP